MKIFLRKIQLQTGLFLIVGLFCCSSIIAAETLRPDLNGLRIKSPSSATVYLIDEGRRRAIPNPETYYNLFRDWNKIVVDINVNSITSGPRISNGAILAKSHHGKAVYLIDNGVKRWIRSRQAMDKYYFSWKQIRAVDKILLDFIPNGGTLLN